MVWSLLRRREADKTGFATLINGPRILVCQAADQLRMSSGLLVSVLPHHPHIAREQTGTILGAWLKRLCSRSDMLRALVGHVFTQTESLQCDVAQNWNVNLLCPSFETMRQGDASPADAPLLEHA